VLGGDVVHVLLVPVLRVAEGDRRLLGLAGLLEFLERCLDHRAQVREVAGRGADLCGDHDLLLVDDRPRVVSLDVRELQMGEPH
jgi:hypothetical protein